MSFAEFAASVGRDSAPPDACGTALQALWHERRGAWERAHGCVQEEAGRDAAWVHAYLHRVEGDAANARYWYARAGREAPPEGFSTATEWETIARALLGA